MGKAEPGLKYSDVLGALSKFWGVFLDITGKAGLVVSPRSEPFVAIRVRETVLVSLKQVLHLKNWPYKAASSSGESLHIMVDGKETVDIRASAVVNSWVQVNYYVEKPSTPHRLLPIESIHYDYKEAPEHAHPLFHAQFCNDLLAPGRENVMETLRDYRFLNDRFGDRFGHLKIPTAHMNLVSVLLSLCADHMPTSSSKQLLGDLFREVKQISKMPTVSADYLTAGLSKGNSYCSLHWYYF